MIRFQLYMKIACEVTIKCSIRNTYTYIYIYILSLSIDDEQVIVLFTSCLFSNFLYCKTKIFFSEFLLHNILHCIFAITRWRQYFNYFIDPTVNCQRSPIQICNVLKTVHGELFYLLWPSVKILKYLCPAN